MTRAASGIAQSLGSLRVLKRSGAQALKTLSTEAAKRPGAEARGLPLQGTAKSAHPDFAAVKVYLRKSTRKAAERKWEDAGGGDLSDLVEKLLQEYVGA